MKNFLKFELTALVLIIISCAVFLEPKELYAHYSDNKIVRDIQLMLTLKGIRAGENNEAIKIDGIYGSQTKAGIKEYERQNNMEETGKPSEYLRSRLYEDINSLTNNNNTDDDTPKKLFDDKKLNKVKEDLNNTNVALRTITDNMSDYYITTYRDIVNTIGVNIGIIAALFGGLLVWGIPKLKEDIEKETTEKLKTEYEKMLTDATNKLDTEHKQILLKIQSRIYTNLSHAFYLYYRDLFNNRWHGGFKSGISLALWFAEGAIANAKKINPGEEQTFLLKNAELHKLYHRTCQCLIPGLYSSKEREDIIDTTKQYLDFAYKEQEIALLYSQETIAWVFILLGSDNEKQEGMHILKKVLYCASPEYREQIIYNYDNLGISIPESLLPQNHKVKIETINLN